ncbi:hypothetical protein D9M70_524770 [compost metagenome]
MITQDGQPLAKIVPVRASDVRARTRLGFLAGAITVQTDVDPLADAEIERLFYGEDASDVQTRAACQVCGSCLATAQGLQFGELCADWQYGRHPGEQYSVRLCEPCFFGALADLRRKHRVNFMFEEGLDLPDETFGLTVPRKGDQDGGKR